MARVAGGPRRVLFLHSSAGRYGADRQLALIVRGLDPERYAASALVPFEGPLADDLRAAGAHVLTGPVAVVRRELLSPPGLVRLARAAGRQRRSLERFLGRHPADVVHANTSVFLGARAAAQAAGARYVTHVREIYPRVPVAWPLHRREILRADRVVCVSEATRDALGAGAGALVVPDGLAVIPERVPRRLARERLGLPVEAFVVAVLGRISGWKGQDVLVRALAEPSLRGAGAIGLVAGDAWPGQEEHEVRLRALAERTGVLERLRLVGFRDDVETVLGAADVVAVPSTRPDPLPNSALEAAAAGCCVVAAGHGGLPEIVRDGATGRLVAPGDAGALARALSELAADPALRERMGRAAAADVRERFDPGRLAERVTSVYDELLAGA